MDIQKLISTLPVNTIQAAAITVPQRACTKSEAIALFCGIAKRHCEGWAEDADNVIVIQNLVSYFIADESCNLDLTKGIMLRGPVGTGKTLIMQTVQKMCQALKGNYFRIATARQVVSTFAESGFKGISEYGFNEQHNGYGMKKFTAAWCFDDLGMEGSAKHYGTESNPMADILLDRYEIRQSYGKLTHCTTNKTPTELAKKYGDRITSRIREMFNDIVLDGKDRRK